MCVIPFPASRRQVVCGSMLNQQAADQWAATLALMARVCAEIADALGRTLETASLLEQIANHPSPDSAIHLRLIEAGLDGELVALRDLSELLRATLTP